MSEREYWSEQDTFYDGYKVQEKKLIIFIIYINNPGLIKKWHFFSNKLLLSPS